jgi:hypothetical protein
VAAERLLIVAVANRAGGSLLTLALPVADILPVLTDRLLAHVAFGFGARATLALLNAHATAAVLLPRAALVEGIDALPIVAAILLRTASIGSHARVVGTLPFLRAAPVREKAHAVAHLLARTAGAGWGTRLVGATRPAAIFAIRQEAQRLEVPLLALLLPLAFPLGLELSLLPPLRLGWPLVL